MTADRIRQLTGSRRVSRRYAISGLLLLYVLLSWVSWHRSGDLLVDWGREVYTAWRLSEGEVLYRDVSSLFGPLASYLNSVLFRVFGPSLTTIQAANVAGIGLLALLLYDTFRRMAGHTGAILATYLFLSMFAYNHVTEDGIFNFVTPYSYDAALGLALCVLLVWMLMYVESRPTVLRGLGAGVACGLAWLSKPEIALAAVATLAVGVLLLARRSERPSRAIWVAIFCGAILPSVATILLFLRPLGLLAALAVPGAAFRSAAATQPWDSPFYYAISGFDSPGTNLGVTVGAALVLVALLGALEILERSLRSQNTRRVVGIALLSAGAIGFVMLHDTISWPNTARPMPVLVSAIFVFAAVRAWTSRGRDWTERIDIGFACWTVLSLALLPKIALLARFYQYGFYLVLPSTLLVAVLLVCPPPRWLPAKPGQFVTSFAILLVGAVSADVLGIGLREYRARSFQVESGGDRMVVFDPYIDPRAFTVSATMDVLRDSAGEISSLLVLPEGAMLNFWLRIPTPTSHVTLLPPELARFGETAVWRALRRNPPDVVVVAERPFEEYGADSFGATKFGSSVDRWLEEDYCLLTQVRAKSTDFPALATTRPEAVARRSHSVSIYSRNGSDICSG